MLLNTREGFFIILVVMGLNGCSVPPKIENSNVQAIALCSGGYSNKLKVALEAEYSNRSGKLIGEGGFEEGGTLLGTDRVNGKDFTDLYNLYSQCIDKRTSTSTHTETNKIQTVSNSRVDGSVTMK